jgi:hypothetical protein
MQTDEIAEVNRAQIEHRATWMGLIYDEMIKADIDAETIIRRAVKRCGRIHGERIKKNCANPKNLEDFKKAFLSDLAKKTFEVNLVNNDEASQKAGDSLSIDFHYCALLNAWKKLRLDDKTCELLCDMAMEGDRGMAEIMELQFNLGNTIAQGCPTCELRFRK